MDGLLFASTVALFCPVPNRMKWFQMYIEKRKSIAGQIILCKPN